MAWTDAAALLITTAGLLGAVLVLVVTRRIQAALPVLLDMLLAAGILRLLGQATWQRIASAALVVAIRHIATAGIALGRRSRHGRRAVPEPAVDNGRALLQ